MSGSISRLLKHFCFQPTFFNFEGLSYVDILGAGEKDVNDTLLSHFLSKQSAFTKDNGIVVFPGPFVIFSEAIPSTLDTKR